MGNVQSEAHFSPKLTKPTHNNYCCSSAMELMNSQQVRLITTDILFCKKVWQIALLNLVEINVKNKKYVCLYKSYLYRQMLVVYPNCVFVLIKKKGNSKETVNIFF